VTGVLAAVSGALVSTTLGMSDIPLPILVAVLMVFTAGLLLFGGYSILDNFIKILSLILLLTVTAAFCVTVYNGPVNNREGLSSINDILTGAGLTLTISLIGFMPAGMDASVFSSMWSIEKMKTTGYYPTLKESIFDFNLGYIFTTIIALMFMTMGAFTIYGSRQLLEGNSVQFTNKLLAVFTDSIGPWSYPIIPIAAFGTIYGSLITAWDAFARVMASGFQILKINQQDNQAENEPQLLKYYKVLILMIGIGGFILYYQFANTTIQMLEFSTIVVFMLAPVISYLNLRVILSKEVPKSHHPHRYLLLLAYVGLTAMILFSGYYFIDLLF
jgi:Mn2+/Fe2+ NRAMP family transporter